MAIFNKLSNKTKIVLAQVNWEALDIIREIEYWERKLKHMDNMSLMVRAIITSNAQLFGEHLFDIKKINDKIKTLHTKLDEVKKIYEEREAKTRQERRVLEEEKWEKTQDPEMGEIRILKDKSKQTKTPEFDPTDLEDFEFADDMINLAELADLLDKQGFSGSADIVDVAISKKLWKLHDPARRQANVLRKAYKGIPGALNKDDIPGPLGKNDIPGSLKKKDITCPFGNVSGPMGKNEISKSDIPKTPGVPLQQTTQQLVEQKLHLTPGSLTGLTTRELSYINNIRNIGLARQWVEHLKRYKQIKQKSND